MTTRSYLIKQAILNSVFLFESTVLDTQAVDKAVETIERALDKETCRWTYQQDNGNWHTGCAGIFKKHAAGMLSSFGVDGVKFCPYCGKKIKADKSDLVQEATDFFGNSSAAEKWIEAKYV